MTLIEFIKSKLSENSELGDLAKDIQNDKEFPSDKTEKEIISYLDYKTRLGGTNSTIKKLIREYTRQNTKGIDEGDLNSKFALFRTENWVFYKDYFPVDKVILV